jgi:hypothetical protein
MNKNSLDLLNKEVSIKFYAVIIVSFIIALLLIFLIFKISGSHKSTNNEIILTEIITELESKYILSKNTIDQLNNKISELEQLLKTVLHPPGLKIKNVDNPISYLKNDLMERKDLIPYQGVLGGTMGFHDKNGIRVLNRKWVYARFDDGHIGGEMLLEYSISGDGKIDWKIIESFQ